MLWSDSDNGPLVEQDGFYNNGRIVEQRNLRVLVLAEIMPILDQGSSMRLRQVLKFLSLNGHKVTYVARDNWDHQMYKSKELRAEAETWAGEHGIDLVAGNIEMSSLPGMLSLDATPYDLLLVCAWFFREFNRDVVSIPDAALPWLAWHSPLAELVVLTDDLHWERCVEVDDCDRAETIKEKERALYTNADLVLSVTDLDNAKILTLAPGAQVVTLPMVLEMEPIVGKVASKEGVARLLFVGSAHSANQQAVTFLLREVLPELLVHEPGATLTLVGDDHWPLMVQAEDSPYMSNVNAFGPMRDLTNFLKEATVIVAPTLYMGSGISTKVFFGLSHRMPTVTTGAGAVGLPCDNASTGGICRLLHVAEGKADGPTGGAFAEAVVAASDQGYDPDLDPGIVATMNSWVQLAPLMSALSMEQERPHHWVEWWR